MTGFTIKDADLSTLIAGPASTGSVYTDPIDLGAGDQDFVADCEAIVEAPALNGTMLPAASTAKYDVQHSDTEGSGYVTLFTDIVVQTGAASVGGAAAATGRVRLPTNVERYVRLKMTSAGSPATMAAVNAELRLAF